MNSSIKSFTIIELLIVLGVISILSAIAVVVLNPAELLKQGRDSTRIQDIRGIDTAINLGRAINPSLLDNTSSSIVYISLPDTDSDGLCDEYTSLPSLKTPWEYRCVASSTPLHNVDGTGWIPIDFTAIAGGSNISTLPIDPKNEESNNRYYTYSLISSDTFSLSSELKSQKYLNQVAVKDGGNSTSTFETAPIAWTTTTIACSGSSFTDDTQAEFDAGAYSGTQWDGTNSWVELSNPPTSGDYTSSIKDVVGSATWDSIAWIPERPTGKELPNSGNSETAYNTGNANMTGNVLLYHMNESSGAIADTSGQGNNGTYNGVLYSQVGKLNTALSFDGSNDYVSVADSANLDITDDITVSLWIKMNSKAPWDSILTKSIVWDGDNGYGFFFRGGGPVLNFFINHVDYGVAVLDPSPSVGEWHHIVGTYDGSNVRIYSDGVEGTPMSYTNSIGTNNKDLRIGYDADLGGYFDGSIDEVAIWNRALSPTEVLDLYKRGVLKLKYQVRSCDDAACSGETFIGPDGTGSDYYEWGTTNSVSTPSFNLTNVIDNQYFQYKTYFESDDSSYSPELKSATVNYSCL